MKKILLLLLFISNWSYAQIGPESLFALPALTTAEMNTIAPLSGLKSGTLFYNTTVDSLYLRTNSAWQKIAPINDISSTDPFLTITNTNNVFEITTNFTNIENELLFEDDDFCYVSMLSNQTEYLVIRYHKADPNIETRATGAVPQPSSLAAVQALTFN
ncbi:hypothetical protein [Tenacibaculum sp. SG-28]|uniref:hypothetical protein n=1 Tax=Tenacibaculum sp. SG-28 TaxID=754426 RepID=UPI000CF3E583|nr:hypothetical protein [Tenacibaculum sp. SG-28]PQJ21185.1 hypothetical protein BSU00_09370 [Tenacibaculum sp. SG-28]